MTNEEKRIKEINETILKIQKKNEDLGKGLFNETLTALDKIVAPVIKKFAPVEESKTEYGAFMFKFGNSTIQISKTTSFEKDYVSIGYACNRYWAGNVEEATLQHKENILGSKIVAKLWEKEDKILNILTKLKTQQEQAETKRAEIETELANLNEEKLYLYSKAIVSGTKYRSRSDTKGEYAWTVLKVSKDSVYYLAYYGDKKKMPLFQFVKDYENGDIVKTI